MPPCTVPSDIYVSGCTIKRRGCEFIGDKKWLKVQKMVECMTCNVKFYKLRARDNGAADTKLDQRYTCPMCQQSILLIQNEKKEKRSAQSD
jgi:hypothetical protein